MQKAIYVGAGTDILPLLCYPNIKKWIYIDSQPNNEFGPEYVEVFRPCISLMMLSINFSCLNLKSTD